MSVANLLSSTSKNAACLKMPQLTSAERDDLATPEEGLTIYNTTTDHLDYYNGTGWAEVTGSVYKNGACVWYLGGAENYPAAAVFPIGSASPNNFIKSFSTFGTLDVTCASGLFTLPSDGVYMVNVTILLTRVGVPTTGNITVSMVDSSGTLYFSEQYQTCPITSIPANFNFNFSFVGQFSGTNNKFQIICHNSSDALFVVEGALLPNHPFQTTVSIQKLE